MATTEIKELKEHPEPLKYKTWVLKVSIHCEACKRGVKKILQNVEGKLAAKSFFIVELYETSTDLKQQKVVVMGNVEAGTLIKKKKLEKTCKHVELWPEKLETKEKKQGKSKNKEKQSNSDSSGEGGGDKEKELVKVEVLEMAKVVAAVVVELGKHISSALAYSSFIGI